MTLVSKDSVLQSHKYPKTNVWVIYETSFVENGDTYFYIGSHFVKNKRDTYFGSSKKIYQLKAANYPLSFKILHVGTKEEQRYKVEGEYIKNYYEQYGKFCINKILDPTTNRSTRWSLERKQHFQQTCQKKFGVEQPFQSETIKEHIKETHQKRLGVDYPMQSEVVREKSKETVKEKYGVDNVSQADSIKEKKSQNFVEKGLQNRVLGNPERMNGKVRVFNFYKDGEFIETAYNLRYLLFLARKFTNSNLCDKDLLNDVARAGHKSSLKVHKNIFSKKVIVDYAAIPEENRKPARN